MYYTLTEKDVRLFLRERPQHSPLKRALTYSAVTLSLGVLLLGTLSYVLPQTTVLSSAPAVLPVSSTLPVADAGSEPTPAPVAVAVATPLPVTLPNNTIAAADLKISAPVIWNVGFTDKEMNAALKNGVIHIAGTATPGQAGMTNIAGHSSNYAWVSGKFNNIFAPLTKAQPGQIIEMNYEGTMYKYRVTRSFEVKPTDVAVLSDNPMTGIRLITCTPVGTSLRRLIVEAEQIFPDPTLAAPFNGANFTGSLPSDR